MKVPGWSGAVTGSYFAGSGALAGATNVYINVQANAINRDTEATWSGIAIGISLGAVFGTLNPYRKKDVLIL